jgi:large repetitive protein
MTILASVNNKTVMPGITPIADVPDRPTIGTATAAGLGASITFTAATTGGTPTTFTATSNPGSITGTASSSPITVSGLTGDTSYTFTVTAGNSTGTSPASAASNSITAVSPLSGGYDALATVIVPSGGLSSITFASIPTGYKSLQLRWIAQTNRATYGFDDLLVRFNSDSSALYSTHYMFGNGSTVSTGADSSATATNVINSAGTTTSGSWWGVAILDLLDYASTSKFKTMRYLNGVDLNGATVGLPGRTNMGSGSYQSINAINSITITSNASSTFQTNTSFGLYGVK